MKIYPNLVIFSSWGDGGMGVKILKLQHVRSWKMMICSKLLDAGDKKARVKESFSTQNKGINVSVCLHCNLQFPQVHEYRKVEQSSM